MSKSMLIKIGYPNLLDNIIVIFFALTWWIINEFEKIPFFIPTMLLLLPVLTTILTKSLLY